MFFVLLYSKNYSNKDMKKALMGSFLRAVCAIAIGILLILYPDSTVLWLTVAIGIVFFISGTISCLAYFNAKRLYNAAIQTDANPLQGATPKPRVPIVGLGSVILGLLLALTPDVFVKFQMYIIGIALIFGAVNQYMSLISAARVARIPFVFWICPTLILLTGLFVVLKPMASAALPMLITGWCCLLYGVTDVINTLKIRIALSRLAKLEQQQAEEVIQQAEEEE